LKKNLCPIDVEQLAHWLKQIADESNFHEETLQGAIQLLVTSRQIDRAVQLIRLLHGHPVFNAASVLLVQTLAEHGHAKVAREMIPWIAKRFRAIDDHHHPNEPQLVLAETTGKLEDIERARRLILLGAATDDRAHGLIRIANIGDGPKDLPWIRGYIRARMESDPEVAVSIAQCLGVITKSSDDFQLFCMAFEQFLFMVPPREVPQELHKVSALAAYLPDRFVTRAAKAATNPTLREHLEHILMVGDAAPQHTIH
jgi:hypothetical protein